MRQLLVLYAAALGLLGCDSASTSATDARASSDAVIDAALEACRDENGRALWTLLTPRFRAEITELADRMATALTTAELKEAYSYPNDIETLDGPTFLDMSVGAPGEHDNPCWKAAQWQESGHDRSHDRHSVMYRLPNGRARGVLALEIDGQWRIGKITQSIDPAE